jgi:WD40 repeat protein
VGVELTLSGNLTSLSDMNIADPTKTHVAKEHKHTRPLIACRFDPSGRFAFFAAQDNRVWRWEWAGETVVELAAHDSWVRAIGFHQANNLTLTGGYDGKLIWWNTDVEKPTPLRTVDAHAGWIRALRVSPDGQTVATCGNDNLVKVWRIDDGTLVHTLAGHARNVYNVAYHPDGKSLVSGDLMGLLLQWDLASGKQERELKMAALSKYDTTFMADIGGFHDLTFSPDGTRLAGCGITEVTNAFAGVGNPMVVVLDWAAGTEKTKHITKGKVQGVAWRVLFHPDQFLIGGSGGGGGGYLLFWKPEQAEEFHQLKLPNTLRDLDLHPDGVHLLSVHHDTKVRISKMAEKPA